MARWSLSRSLRVLLSSLGIDASVFIGVPRARPAERKGRSPAQDRLK
jgi:hypothetical protein